MQKRQFTLSCKRTSKIEEKKQKVHLRPLEIILSDPESPKIRHLDGTNYTTLGSKNPHTLVRSNEYASKLSILSPVEKLKPQQIKGKNNNLMNFLTKSEDIPPYILKLEKFRMKFDNISKFNR